MSLIDVLPDKADPDQLYEAFLEWASEQGLALYPHQEEAAIELFDANNVVLATPTGSGKSLVGVAAQPAALTSQAERARQLVDQRVALEAEPGGPFGVAVALGLVEVVLEVGQPLPVLLHRRLVQHRLVRPVRRHGRAIELAHVHLTTRALEEHCEIGDALGVLHVDARALPGHGPRVALPE